LLRVRGEVERLAGRAALDGLLAGP